MRLFCPSYQIPGSWAENALFIASEPRLAGIVGIELLLFRYNREDRELFRSDLPRLKELTRRFAYSLHLPVVVGDSGESDVSQRRLLQDAGELAEGAVMHFPPLSAGEDRVRALSRREELSREFGIEIALENSLETPCRDLPEELPLCLDTGHALLGEEAPGALLKRYGRRISALHLHGTAEGRDHAPLTPDAAWFPPVGEFLRSFSGRVVLELFDLQKLLISLKTVESEVSR